MPAGKLTLADWTEFPDDLLRHEIIDGIHYTQRGATTLHQGVLMELMASLRQYALERGDYIVHIVGTVLSEHDAVIPDLVYIRRDRRAILGKDYIEGPPEIVVEVVSDESRVVDNTIKHALYERVGVSEYWVVDSEEETVTIHRRAGGRLVPAKINGTISSPLLPGISLSCDRLFARVNEWLPPGAKPTASRRPSPPSS